MPTPVGHSLAGVAVHLAWRGVPVRRAWVLVGCLIVLANLPDIDLVPGYVVGEPRAYHWKATHSLVASLLAGLGFGLLGRRLTGRFLPYFVVGGVAYGSHVVMDLLLGPGSRPLGIQVFWPFSADLHMAPWSVFKVMPGAIHEVGPVRVLFSRSALPLFARELMVMVPVCAAAWLAGRVAQGQRPRAWAGEGTETGTAGTDRSLSGHNAV